MLTFKLFLLFLFICYFSSHQPVVLVILYFFLHNFNMINSAYTIFFSKIYKHNEGFKDIISRIAKEKARIDQNEVSLNFAVRKAEEDEAEVEFERRKESQKARYAEAKEKESGLFTVYKLTQDNVISETLTLRDELSEEELSGMTRATSDEEDPEKKLLEPPHGFSDHERETLNILQDMIAISETGQPVNISDATLLARPDVVPIPALQDKAN